jgi:hypothetical protein
MGKVRLAGRVPDDQYNGLIAISQRLVEEPHEVILAVVKIDVAEIRNVIHDPSDERHEAEEQIPVIKLLAIEPLLHEPEKKRAAELFRAGYFARTGEGNTLEDSGVLAFPRSRDAQETGESDWPTPPAPSSEVAKQEPGDEDPGQHSGEDSDPPSSSAGTAEDGSDELPGDGTGQALPPVPEAAYAEDAVPLDVSLDFAPPGAHLRAVPAPAFSGPAD